MKIEVKEFHRPVLMVGQIWKRTEGFYTGHHYLVVGLPRAGDEVFMVDLSALDEHRLIEKTEGEDVGDGFEFVGTLEVTL